MSANIIAAHNYIGRFAPSPSGSLHFGSLITALASFLQAKSQSGAWHLRIDNVDNLRIVVDADRKICQALEAYHLFWDGPVIYQSHNHELYQAALNLITAHIFACTCTRKQLKTTPVYPGTCRNKNYSQTNKVIRCKVKFQQITIDDLCCQQQQFDLIDEVGDFILCRQDGVFSYQLATVVDDINLGVTEIIRGSDLLAQTAKQIYLYQLLHRTPPQYGHIPLAKNKFDQKLSKQTHAQELSLDHKIIKQNLFLTLEFLNHKPDCELDSVAEIISWAIANWDIDNINRS